MTETTDFWVGDRFVRPSLGEIQLGPERVHIEPRSMEVLLALAGRPSEVIPKKELIDAVWGDAFVSDEVLTHAVWDLRRAFGDQASDPEFIQTVPKKGYRLIAPVKPIQAPRRRATDRARAAGSTRRQAPSTRKPLWALALIAVLLAAGFWAVKGPLVDSGSSQALPRTVLALEPTDAPAELVDAARRLDSSLRTWLTGIQDVELRVETTCRPIARAAATYCLRPVITSMTDAFTASASFREATSSSPRYAAPIRTLATRSELNGFAEELAQMTSAFFEVLESESLDNPDLVPWLSLQGRDIRAIRDFLQGAGYALRDEAGGGRNPMDTAIERDPGFIAPRVWRTPAILAEAGEEDLAAHLEDLERVYGGGSGFENAMVQWAIALVRGDKAAQIRELNSALREKPENRPARLSLGYAYLDREEHDRAWAAFEQLVATDWDYPPLYPLATLSALHLDKLEDARRSLDRALPFDRVDPHSLELLRLMAIYDDKPEDAARFGDRFERSKEDNPFETIDSETLASAAGHLADKAESEGRREIADRLRESGD